MEEEEKTALDGPLLLHTESSSYFKFILYV